MPLKSQVHIDATAAKSIAERKGVDKIRHIDVNVLWLQDQVARNKIAIHKISGEDNFSDSFTKHATADRIAQTLLGTSQKIVAGRHPIMPTIAQ